MNGKVAKKLRKLIYGEDLSPRFRKYRIAEPKLESGIPSLSTFIVADNARIAYKTLKKIYKAGGWERVKSALKR